MQDKTMKIIEYISENPHNNTILTISQNTGISKSTVHRMVRVLIDDLVITPKSKSGYALTPKLFSLAINSMQQKNVMDHAVPILREVSLSTRETVSFYVLSGYDRVCVYHVEGEYPYYRTKIGDKGPLFRGSVGMVLAAFMDKASLQRIKDIYIERGVLSEEQINNSMKLLPEIKEKGFAVSMGQRHPGTASIAVPILDICGCATAALAIATDLDRMTPEAVEEYSKLLINVARQVCM